VTKYRAGQRVRIEWPTGAVLEGPITYIGGTQPENGCVLSIGNAVSVDVPGVDDRVVTVLSEPRPDEPQGLGAVVEARFITASFEDEDRKRYVRRPLNIGDAGYAIDQFWVSEDGRTYSSWRHLRGPVVLSEGWTP
jgi:hypothetical protein